MLTNAERRPLLSGMESSSREGSRLNSPASKVRRFTATKVTLTWKDLSYEVHIPSSRGTPAHMKRIIHNVSGYVSAGQVMAILGPSGAGKTTMLDILAQRQKSGTISGELLMNGHPVDPGVFRRVSAYVQQEDLLHGYLKVRETVRYAAKLRTPPDVSQQEINDRCEHILSLLNIVHVADRKIGTEVVRGVSGGEKKRTAIAVELVTNPSLIFLDEPTTGLDTFTAMHLIYILKMLTRGGATVVFSIHQPRSTIFHLFDTLLVLNGHGEQAYFGPAKEAVAFLESAGVRSLHPDNPADFVLDSVSVVRATELMNTSDFPFIPPASQARDIAEAFARTNLPTVHEQIESLKGIFVGDSKLPDALRTPYYRSFFVQVAVVSQRAFINKLRDPFATVIAVAVAIMFALLTGSIYFQLPTSQEGIQDRVGVLFFLTMNVAFSNLGALSMFLFDRSIYAREHRNGMYRPSAYFFGKVAQDIPISSLVNLIFSAIAYSLVGLRRDAVKFGWYALISTLILMNSYGVCLFVSSISKNYQVANIIAPLILVLYLIPSGVLLNLNSIPVYWRWIKYISFFRYGYEGLVINEFHGLNFSCDYPSPVNATWSVDDAVATCIPTGDIYMTTALGFNVDDFATDVAVVGGSAGVYFLLGYLGLRFFVRGEGK